MDKETYFIQTLIKSGVTEGLGDDGVVICSKGFFKNPSVIIDKLSMPVYALDMFCEGVHFKKEWLSPKIIGKKAFLVNFSDILAMNATPKYALLGISLPKDISKAFILELINGIACVCKEYGVKIIGGDTIKDTHLCLNITMIGEGSKNIIFRKGAKIGDLILHTGVIGSSNKALNYLLKGGKVLKSSRFYNPILRGGFIKDIGKKIHLGMDISDGIYAELNRLSKLNNLNFRLFKPFKKIYNSGEEYEFLFCISPKEYLCVKNIAKKHRLNVECIGKIERGKNIYPNKIWH